MAGYTKVGVAVTESLQPLTRVSQVTNEGCPCPAGKGKWKRQQTSVIQPDEPRENGDEHRKTERVVWTPTHILLASSKSVCLHQGLSPGQGRSQALSRTSRWDIVAFHLGLLTLSMPYTDSSDSPAGLSQMDPGW